MMRLLLLFPVLLLSSFLLQAQLSTSLEVYQIFQQKCASCHSGSTPEAGLDLTGQGSTEAARAADVYSNIFRTVPANAQAAVAGDYYVYPGRPDRSYLFRKISNGFEPTVTLDTDEGQPMPAYGGDALTEVEKEMIRQWILFGAQPNGTQVDRSLIEAYYTDGGQQAFPEGPPPAPDPSEGFQIKMGPFYLAPGEELEFFQKYELTLPEDSEVNELDMDMGTYSHHLIVYNFGQGAANNIADGLRLDPLHEDIGLIAAIQEPTDLKLPEGTAFLWDNDLVLDLNSHYINYSATLAYQAEAYINVYTQDPGTAIQEMETALIVNGDIYIPNNENTITYDQVVNPSLGEIYLWGIMGHTHQYGTSYKAWKRNSFQRGELIYDAACPQGIPGCFSPNFDYQHIPLRYFEPLQPINMSWSDGLIHEASWMNDGPEPVWFGPTSDDEMMVLVLMFTTDSTGLQVVNTREPKPIPDALTITPNPAQNQLQISSPTFLQNGTLKMLDATGRAVLELPVSGENIMIQRGNWPAGVYSYQLRDGEGKLYTGKILWSPRE